MQPHDSTTKPPAKNAALRYGFSLILLVAIVGGIAWLVQYLPSMQKKISPPPPVVKKLLDFPEKVAKWTRPEAATQKEKVYYPFQDCEVGSSGFYDFPFRNVAGEDVEITAFNSTCDCTTVKACASSAAEVERFLKQHQAAPVAPFVYDKEPAWHELHADNRRADMPNAPKENLLIKAGEGGVVRVMWTAKKSAGQDLNVNPLVLFRLVSDPGRRDEAKLSAAVKVMMPVQFMPQRGGTGVLGPNAIGRAEFKAWSSTREKFTIDLNPTPPDPLISIQMRPFSTAECGFFEKELIDAKIATRVVSAFHVTVLVHESKGEHQLEQGVFFRKLPVTLDGRPTDLTGPEIVGAVKGDVQVGGADDQGKVRFPSFEAKYGASKSVELSTDAKIGLKEHLVHPSWVKTKLTRKTKEPVEGRHIWELEVTVPPDARDARSFRDEDAVVLMIPGKRARFVRIPLEGHITGGR